MHPKFLLPQATRAIESVCRRYPVSLAYVFGSHARGTADTESDVDIAVLLTPDLSPRERHRLRLLLMPELAAVLHLDVSLIDLVVLQDARLLLQYNAISGVPVFATHTSA